jgi:toxin YoeB
MVKQIIWTRRAYNDRKEILEYWRIHNQSNIYSKKLNQLFKKAITLIAAHPHIGRRTNMENVRVKLVRDYLVFYEESETEIFILTIWDSRRNPEEIPFP